MMDKLFDGSDAHLLPGNAELIQRLRCEGGHVATYGDCLAAADALEAAEKRIAMIEEAAAFNFEQYQDSAFLLCEANQRLEEERETHDRMMEEGAEKLFAAESEYKAMANLAAAYLRDKQEAEKRIAELEAAIIGWKADQNENMATAVEECKRANEAERKLAVAREAMQNLVAVKGRYHTEQAYNRIVEALAQIGGDDAG